MLPLLFAALAGRWATAQLAPKPNTHACSLTLQEPNETRR